MKQLCSTRFTLEAHAVRLFLESQGIEAKVFGDRNALETEFAFTPATEPSVFVNEADYERATALLEDFCSRDEASVARGSWTCPKCGESVPAVFEACWNCQSLRGDAAIEVPSDEPIELPDDSNAAIDEHPEPRLIDASEPARATWTLWTELVIVLAIVQTYYGWPTVLRILLPTASAQTTFVGWFVVCSVCKLTVMAVVLAIIFRGGERWSKFGLCRPRLLTDLASGLALYILTVAVVHVGVDSLKSLLSDYLDPAVVYRLLKREVEPVPLQGGFDVALAVLAALIIGLSEELVWRGYLIVRLERLLHSTWAAVLVSAVAFAALHWYQGIVGVWGVFLIGALFGAVFAYFRRIWPLVVTHALIDIVVMVWQGV